MISIIVCSKNIQDYRILHRNIQETIGLKFEMIRINNEANSYSICEAYNLGILKSNFDIICLCHEDVSFFTMDWGLKVDRHLEDKKVGLIGLAGSDTFSNIPNGWWVQSKYNSLHVRVLQRNKAEHSELHSVPFKYHSTNKSSEAGHLSKENKEEVVVLDGVWLCGRREVFKKYRFDDQLLNVFHGYDIDISLSIHLEYSNYVINDVVIMHKSIGAKTQEWVDSCIQLSEKWKGINVVTVQNDKSRFQEIYYKCNVLYDFCLTLIVLENSSIEVRRLQNRYFYFAWRLLLIPSFYLMLVIYVFGNRRGMKINSKLVSIKQIMKG